MPEEGGAAMIFGKMLIFLSTLGPSSSPQAVQYEFIDPKPMQKASFFNFRKSQEFSSNTRNADNSLFRFLASYLQSFFLI